MNPIPQAVLLVHGRDSGRRTVVPFAGPDVRQGDMNEVLLWFEEYDPGEKIRITQPSLFFHPLPSGNYTIGRMIPLANSRAEVQQPSFLVQHWFVAPQTLAAFANNPFSLYRSILREHALDSPPDPAFHSLETIVPQMPLPVPEIINFSLLEELIIHPGPKMVALLLQAIIDSVCTFFVGGGSGQRILEGLFNLLPLEWRTELSFSSDLMFSSLRPFRAIGIPGQNARMLREFEKSGFSVCDLSSEHSTARPSIGEFAPWSRMIYYVLQKRQFSFFASKIADENSLESFQDQPDNTKILHQFGVDWLREAVGMGILSDLPEPHNRDKNEREADTVSFPLPWVKHTAFRDEPLRSSPGILDPTEKFIPALFRPSIKTTEVLNQDQSVLKNR